MCGIAGVFERDGHATVSPARVRAMTDAIAHRGPDAEGIWTGYGIGLGHRRLSIIDLAGGDQPIENEDGSVRVVFNGEIYNYRRLRDDLIARGHRFRTESDTEVLVHLYEEHGASLVTRLRGMFAFAIWDERRSRLTLARDRVGQKPLYYFSDGDRLVFGSEPRALLTDAAVPRDVDRAAVEAFLAFGCVPGDLSIFRAVRKLRPAHVLTVSRDDRSPRIDRYWRLDVGPDDGPSGDEWVGRVREKFAETVDAHRVADVPVGAFLSGGLDSSAVVAELSGGPAGPPRTFSIGFREEAFSELPYARAVSEEFGTCHAEEIVTADAAAGLDELTRCYDEPFADPSAIPTMAVARLAARHVKVVMSGDGGDEAFGGYSRYHHDLLEARVRDRLPAWLRRAVLAPLAGVWPASSSWPRPLRWKSALTNLSHDGPEAYARTVAISDDVTRRRLLGRSANGTAGPTRFVTEAYRGGGDALHAMTLSDVGMLLPDDFLVKVDRASMAHGLEVRPPLLDHELLELAFRVPSRFKIRDGETKSVFKKANEGRLPRELIYRRKQGFDIPVDAWLRGPLRETLHETLTDPGSRLRDLVDVEAAERLFDAHVSGRGRRGKTLWSLLVLGRWAERYLSPASA